MPLRLTKDDGWISIKLKSGVIVPNRCRMFYLASKLFCLHSEYQFISNLYLLKSVNNYFVSLEV